jgi:hypothetical protein
MLINYVLVVEVPEQLDLPQRALGIHVVVECVRDLFDRHHLPRFEVHHRAAHTQFFKKKWDFRTELNAAPTTATTLGD